MDSSRYQPSRAAARVAGSARSLRTLSTRIEVRLSPYPAVLPSPAAYIDLSLVLVSYPMVVRAVAGGSRGRLDGVPSAKLCVKTDLADLPALRGQTPYLYRSAAIEIVALQAPQLVKNPNPTTY